MLQADRVANLDLAARNDDGSVTAQMRQDATDRLDGEAEMIGDIGAAHRQIQHLRSGPWQPLLSPVLTWWNITTFTSRPTS